MDLKYFAGIRSTCDVFIANAVGNALRKLGVSAKTIWIADDHDPLRKVPYPLPESYEKYLGMPYSKIPWIYTECSDANKTRERLRNS